ncbi:MAG TPA: hypothetical protein VF215_02855 [Thermoanaerobaculia bacterium]
MRTPAISLLRAAALLVLFASGNAHASQEKLASAKNLYESASYEAALSELSAIDSRELVDDVETYKALCFLGLGRVREAEQALALVVARKPLQVLSDTEYSPRVVALYRDVRKKALPAVAQQLYSLARMDYENKNYESAATGFKQTLLVIADVGPESQSSTLADLKELSAGFLELANTRIAAARARPPVPPAATPVVATRPEPAFYTLADKDVTPPVELDQVVPRWTFSANLPMRAFSGTLELLIDEKGQVETATLSDPVWPAYDAMLIQAAKRWRYAPALKAGNPVKFKRILVLNIDPRVPPTR